MLGTVELLRATVKRLQIRIHYAMVEIMVADEPSAASESGQLVAGNSLGPRSTPMLAQYFAIKKTHPESLLFFRMGDFYEMFFNDASAAGYKIETKQ